MHRLRVSCSNAQLRHNLLPDKLYRDVKSLIASRTNRIVMSLRRCVIRCRLDKSNRISTEMCYVFHCAAVSSSDIFKTAVSIALCCSVAPKLSRQSFFVHEIETAVLKISDVDTAAQ